MTNRYVYLAGPIFGVSFDDATEWRALVKARFAPGIKGVSPMRGKEFLRGEKKIGSSYETEPIAGAATPVAARDFFDVAHADLLFAYLPRAVSEKRPFCGTLLEIGAAIQAGTLVVLVSDDPRVRDCPLIKGKVGWQLDTLEDGIKAVNLLLEEWVG